MKKSHFEEIVGQIREAHLPDCPVSLESNVLGRIRLSADEAGQSLFDWLLGLVPRPGFVCTAFILTIAISLSSTIISIDRSADLAKQDLVASKALGFDVFQSSDLFNLHH